jgi:micrococcal nuclease
VARIVLALTLLAVAGFAAAASVAAQPSFRMQGPVTRVVDGDTIDVRVGSRVERVRLIGIDSPERGDCYSGQATAALGRLVSGRRVTLLGDATQTRRDRYGRLLAYVALPTGVDAGRAMLQQGFATVYETVRPFARRTSYVAAASRASSARVGLWSACGAAAPVPVAPPASGKCHPSYPSVCIPPAPPDLDCGQISLKHFRVVHTVADPDPHRFDGDRDGIGCES